MTDQDVITILSRRHVEVLEELEHARRLAVLLEQNMAMETASWRRNMPQTDLEIQRRGYAIGDGPSSGECGAVSPHGFVCERPTGHEGPHETKNLIGRAEG